VLKSSGKPVYENIKLDPDGCCVGGGGDTMGDIMGETGLK